MIKVNPQIYQINSNIDLVYVKLKILLRISENRKMFAEMHCEAICKIHVSLKNYLIYFSRKISLIVNKKLCS